MVIDFRKVNAAAKKDAYPLPYIDAISEKLRVAQYVLTIDLTRRAEPLCVASPR